MTTKIVYNITFFCTLLLACNTKTEVTKDHEVLPENTVEMNSEQYKVAGIELGNVEQKNIPSILKLNGVISVSPQNIATVCAQMGGYVKSTSLLQGSPVCIGQVLAIIENPEFIELQQNYLESKSKLEYAEADYNRQKALYKENVNSAKVFQQSMADYKSLKTQVYALEQKLALIGINALKLTEENISRSVAVVSPISGYIKTVNVNIGKYINPTDVMFEIINNNNLILELTVFEKDVDKISTGQHITFRMPNKSSELFNAVVYQVGKSINDDKTIKVYATITSESKMLLPGMFAIAELETNENLVNALPNEAIVGYEDKNYIFVSKGKRKENNKEVNDFELIEIIKGASNNGYSEITFPKKLDIKKSKIVIKGTYHLLSALKNGGEMAC